VFIIENIAKNDIANSKGRPIV